MEEAVGKLRHSVVTAGCLWSQKGVIGQSEKGPQESGWLAPAVQGMHLGPERATLPAENVFFLPSKGLLFSDRNSAFSESHIKHNVLPL